MTVETPTPARRARFRIAAVLVCLSVFAAACGDDDDAASPDKKPDSELATFCKAVLKVEEAGRADSGEEGDVAAAKAFAAAIVVEVERMLAVTPASVRSDVETMLATAEGVANDGDGSEFESPDFTEAQTNWHKAGVESCGWNIEKVSLTEYHFDGIPDTLPAGVTSFELTNDGSEIHLLSVLRRDDGVDTDFAELLAQSDETGLADMTEVGVGFVAPGQSSFALAELTPGDYVVICPIPVGAGDGPPAPDARTHYEEGMQHQFTVG